MARTAPKNPATPMTSATLDTSGMQKKTAPKETATHVTSVAPVVLETPVALMTAETPVALMNPTKRAPPITNVGPDTPAAPMTLGARAEPGATTASKTS